MAKKKKFNKRLLVPIVALVILFAQNITGYKFSSYEIQLINDSILSLSVLLGIAASPTVEDSE